MNQDTPAGRRLAIREAAAQVVEAALAGVHPDCQVFASRGNAGNARHWVSVYLDEGVRAAPDRQVKTAAQVQVRYGSNAPAATVDAALDELASHVQPAMAAVKLPHQVSLYLVAWEYVNFQGSAASGLVETYQIVYRD